MFPFSFMADHPFISLIVAGIIFILVWPYVLNFLDWAKIKRNPPRPAPKPITEAPDRFFTTEQLREGHQRAGNRCEYRLENGERCPEHSAEGDHFYPFSRGGATTLQNFVSACKYHNQLKSARVWEEQKPLIENARQYYFPEGTDPTVGEWRKSISILVGNKVPRTPQDRHLVLQGRPLDSGSEFREGLSEKYIKTHPEVNNLRTAPQVIDYVFEHEEFFLEGVYGNYEFNNKLTRIPLMKLNNK